ncbi:NAD-dependent protein deacylase [Leptospira ryugenii]|uniref:NAD-dependent protein deacylase n=1 Tax=Leptospira ryugenii TaxID=1917863 RepID=A0A2P2DZ01_9LEPT|nr:NAD-dependent deacylase [Leptospira ryugenii]GBF49854.1 NAD-dependent protein deacylase [Leptospira ryugenii]
MQEFIHKLKQAKRVAVLTGAGISQESGIPTFRGEGGLWKQYRAEELATPEAFRRDPQLVWEWYEWRKKICSEAKPNIAHLKLADWEKKFPEFHLFTQNVDGLHRRAGSQQVTSLHGDIFSARCTKCKYFLSDRDRFWDSLPPHCPSCGSLLRPHIVWFGESYFEGDLDFAFSFLKETDFLFVVGTSGSVGVPVQLAAFAKANGATTVEINPMPSGYQSMMDIQFSEKAGEFFSRIDI